MFVLNEIRKSNSSIQEFDVAVLAKRGYTDFEISAAFSWLIDRFENPEAPGAEVLQSGALSFRILHPAEQRVISAEAFGYLLELRQLHILSQGELELIIERAMLSGFEKLDAGDVRALVSALLFENDPAQGRSRYVLNTGDRIH